MKVDALSRQHPVAPNSPVGMAVNANFQRLLALAVLKTGCTQLVLTDQDVNDALLLYPDGFGMSLEIRDEQTLVITVDGNIAIQQQIEEKQSAGTLAGVMVR